MIETRKDIFGNTYTIRSNPIVLSKSYKQRLTEAKQKDAYKQYMKNKRTQQIQGLKQGIQKTNMLTRRITSQAQNRATQTIQKTGLKNKLYYLVKGKQKPIYKEQWIDN